METLKPAEINTTIFLLNIENMYPLIKYSTVEKAVSFFGENLTREEKKQYISA